MCRMSKSATLSRAEQALLACLWVGASAGLTSRAAAQSTSPYRLVEALVCVVGADTPTAGADVVLLSDVQFVALLAAARRNEPVEITPALMEAARAQLVGELLIERESRRLHTGEPTPDEVAHQREAIARSLGGAERLAGYLVAWDVSESELTQLASRRATVERFLAANLEGGTSASDADVEEAYRAAGHPFVGRPFEEVREALRGWLEVTRLEQSVARWLTVLRQRSDVHIVRDLNPRD